MISPRCARTRAILFAARWTVAARRASAPALLGMVLTAALLMPSAPQANDLDLRAHRIPASACHESVTDTLNFGQFRVAGPNKAAVAECPLPISNIELSAGATDNDMTRFRIHYRDSDGRGDRVLVQVEVFRRNFAGNGPDIVFICGWDSNRQGGSATFLTSATVDCPEDISATGFYTFMVQLRTSSSAALSAQAVFNGIDFP